MALGALILAICLPALFSARIRSGHELRYKQQLSLFGNLFGNEKQREWWGPITTWSWILGGLFFGAAFLVGGLLTG